MPCIKKGFASRKAVRLFFKQRRKLSGVCRVYFCEDCQSWHHTSKSAEYVRRLKDNKTDR